MKMGEPSNLSTAAINSHIGRRKSFVNHSQAGESKLSTRKSSAEILEAEFNASTSAVKVDYWACYREQHQNPSFHYHCALKLISSKKWLSVMTCYHNLLSRYDHGSSVSQLLE